MTFAVHTQFAMLHYNLYFLSSNLQSTMAGHDRNDMFHLWIVVDWRRGAIWFIECSLLWNAYFLLRQFAMYKVWWMVQIYNLSLVLLTINSFDKEIGSLRNCPMVGEWKWAISPIRYIYFDSCPNGSYHKRLINWWKNWTIDYHITITILVWLFV